jgi:hypothetical protein
MGQWQGTGAPLLHLKGPVELPALENLLRGQAPDGSRSLVADASDPNRLAAWRVVMTAPAVLNSAWTVMPRRLRIRVEHGFACGVKDTLKELESGILFKSYKKHSKDNPGGLVAVFRSNIDEDRLAQLQATALLLSSAFHRDGRVETFAPQSVMSQEAGVRDFFPLVISQRVIDELQDMPHHIHSDCGLSVRLLDLQDKLQSDWSRFDPENRKDERGLAPRQTKQAVAHCRRYARVSAQEASWEEPARPDQLDLFQELGRALAADFRRAGRAAPRAIESLKHLFRKQEHSQEQEPNQTARDKDMSHSH